MSETVSHNNNNLKSILVFSTLILHLLVFLISGLLWDSTSEETLSVFRCDEVGPGTMYHEPFECDTDGDANFFPSVVGCCLWIILILPFFGGLNTILEFPLEEFEQYASKLSWLIIFSCLIPAVIGFNFIVEENKFMNEQFEEIEANNYNYYELWRYGDFEPDDFEGMTILFGGTSAIGSLIIWMGILEEKEKKEREKEKEGES
jgi:ABC-type cobalt transport system substrate-binding protein